MKKIIKINLIFVLILVICSLYCIAAFAEEAIQGVSNEISEEQIQDEKSEETELDSLKNKKNELEQTVSNSYLQMGVIQNQLSETLYEVEKINLSILEKQIEIENLEKEEKDLLVEIEKVQEELKIETYKCNTQKELLDERLIAMYEMGKTTYLDMLLSAKSLTEFLSNYYMISEIAKVDQDLIKLFSETKARVQKLSKSLETKKIILEQSKTAQEEAKIVLENMLIIQNNKLTNLTEEERVLHEQIAEYQNQLNNIEYEIRLLSLANVGAEYVGGIMAWPVPGYTRITSQYGMRTHPITGIYKLHTGVDIGAPIGANFVAANDGIVVKAGYNIAYGNMVILDHGGGIQTLYAHGTDILVEVGDTVMQGTSVLSVGSTGYSTGPHAHFEVRVNGECVEPLDYITSYNLQIDSNEKAEDIEQNLEIENNNVSTNETEEENVQE